MDKQTWWKKQRKRRSTNRVARNGEGSNNDMGERNGMAEIASAGLGNSLVVVEVRDPSIPIGATESQQSYQCTK